MLRLKNGRALWVCATVAALIIESAWAQNVRRKGETKKRETQFEKVAPTPFVRPASVTGTVVDAETGEALIGVRISLVGTSLGTFSDENGRFRFDDLPSGEYALLLDYASYKRTTVEKVTAQPGKQTQVHVPLEAEGIRMQAVEVQAQARAASDAALILLQRRDIRMTDGYSGDMILHQTPDFQVSTALRRMPGLALLEERNIVMRGLPERYNLTLINGSMLPTTDLERAAFDFTVIPFTNCREASWTFSFPKRSSTA
ncbi:MAG: carboxypeptidase-like regulatory domain-containing protein [Bacteroidia bacterium]|nr:carboxypeptidase-like regulatory domain-containing protein [Bacteroidia bacterium]